MCFLMLTRCFGGRYVNFGVFELYGDKALEVALSTMFELILSIPFEDLMVRILMMCYKFLTTNSPLEKGGRGILSTLPHPLNTNFLNLFSNNPTN